MSENYTKPWLSVDVQLHLLQQRGMVVSDLAKACDYSPQSGKVWAAFGYLGVL